MFKSKSIYIKLKRDYVEVTDLETSETISKHAARPFSSVRNIVSSFTNANETIELALKELGIGGTFFKHRLLNLIDCFDIGQLLDFLIS